VTGWSQAELRDLRALDPATLAGRFAVLPSELAPASKRAVAPLQPMAGRFYIEEEALLFEPRFPFVQGQSYSLLVTPAAERGLVRAAEVWTIQRPAASGVPTTSVVAIYPTGPAVPLNLLRLYLHFSSPMSEGRAATAVSARRAEDGRRLEHVFLDGPELWDPGRRRLTLLLDPGRIKRGLAPNQEAGYPLAHDVPIIVHVDTSLRDAAGRPLSSPAERRFDVGAALRARVDPQRWRLAAPAAASTAPLVLSFDRALDHGLLLHCLSVRDEVGAPVPGRAVILPGETAWRFEPVEPWRGGAYAVAIDSRLEDVAGNSIARVFDRDLTLSEDDPREEAEATVRFLCS
jgi:hypothetical protein